MGFIAIDFETANSKRSSACSVGIALFDQSGVKETKHWFIKPTPYYFDIFNTCLHGIRERDVCNSPEFNEVWSELYPYLENNLVLAHNASFDVSVIRKALDCFSNPYGTFDYFCTYKLATVVMPGFYSYRLDVLCEYFDIKFQHHDAAFDAMACAELFLKLLEKDGSSTLEEVMQKHQITIGHVDQITYSPCSIASPKKSCTQKLQLDNIECIYHDDALFGNNFVFTGTLSSMPRVNAQKIVLSGGGLIQKTVTRQTDFLVTGIQDIKRLNGKSVSSKMQKAIDLSSQGFPIQIISEEDFLKMIDSELLDIMNQKETVSQSVHL